MARKKKPAKGKDVKIRIPVPKPTKIIADKRKEDQRKACRKPASE